MTAIINNMLDDRVAATYKTKDDINQAKIVLTRKLGIRESKVKIIAPSDNMKDAKLEGKSQKVGSNMLMSHVRNTLLGFVIGMIIAFLLVQYGPALTQNNPMFTYIALISPGIFIGMFFAGFRSLKPEHDIINQHAVKAQQENYWTLLIETKDTDISKDAICEEIEHTKCVELKSESI
jgi:uncharacterized protein YacL